VHDLRKEGFLDAVRGRSGGVRLARSASSISAGDVVRTPKAGFDLLDCGSCVIAPGRALSGALHEARAAFMAVLDEYSLADLVEDRKAGLRELFASFDQAATPAEAA